MDTNGKIAIAVVAGLVAGSLFTAVAFAGATLAHRTFRNVVAQRTYDRNGLGMMGQGRDGFGMMDRGGQRGGTTDSETMRRFMDRYRDSTGGDIDMDSMHEDMLGGSWRSPSRGPNGYSGPCY